MSTVTVTIAAAATAIGLAAAPIHGPRPAAELVVSSLIGGKPDTLVANSKATIIGWSAGDRAGTIRLENGLFVIRHEKLTSGSFTLDMRNRLAARTERVVAPARGGPRADDGITDAASFYPRAFFTSSSAERLGQARWRITGTLVLNDVSRTVSFDADVTWPETGHMVATSALTLDPKAFGARLIDDAGRATDAPVQVALTLDATRKPADVAAR